MRDEHWRVRGKRLCVGIHMCRRNQPVHMWLHWHRVQGSVLRWVMCQLKCVREFCQLSFQSNFRWVLLRLQLKFWRWVQFFFEAQEGQYITRCTQKRNFQSKPSKKASDYLQDKLFPWLYKKKNETETYCPTNYVLRSPTNFTKGIFSKKLTKLF